MTRVRYRTVEIDGCEIFYREAGERSRPTLLLLHGFPTSSHMFRDLIPLLADRFHLVAPDLPGFGQTKAPPRKAFDYTFDRLTDVIEGFTRAIGLDRYALYVFDYGAPVGLRLAMRHPERVSAIVSQNGNAYLEGFSDQWGAWQAYWREPSEANREACRPSLSPETMKDGGLALGQGVEIAHCEMRACHTGCIERCPDCIRHASSTYLGLLRAIVLGYEDDHAQRLRRLPELSG